METPVMLSRFERDYEAIERAIQDHYDRRGEPPSIRDIAHATGLPKTTVGRRLLDMEEGGMVSRLYSRWRSVRLQ